jgi:WD40 repeat protein
VKYWDLETNDHISTTSPDPTAISQICFEPEEGRYMFSASNNSLKVWDIEQANMVDQVESNWSGVTDLAVSKAEGILVGLSITSQAF